MLRKFALTVALAAVSVLANAQAANFNCTGTGAAPNTCHAVTDAAASPVVTCKIYKSGVVFVSAAVVANACNVLLPTLNGAITITATFVDGTGAETAQSAPFVFNSLVPLLPPQNLHITNP